VAGGGRSRAAALLLAAVLGLSACTGDGEEPVAEPTGDRLETDCQAAVDQLLVTAQRYLDSIGGTSASGAAEPEPDPNGLDPAEAEREFTSALSNLRTYAGSIGCDPAEFRDDLAAGMRELQAGGPGGVVAALAAAPHADVVFVAHTGLEHLSTVRDLWRGLPMDADVVKRWDFVAAADVPRGREAQAQWLFERWAEMDRWVAANRQPARR
jgi:hypothetical protein